MLNRDFYTAIASNETLDAEIREFAQTALTKMDAANEKRRNTPSKTALANAPLIEKIVTEILNDEGKTASEVAEVLEITVQKASALLRTAVKNGDAVAEDVKVPGKGTAKAYRKA